MSTSFSQRSSGSNAEISRSPAAGEHKPEFERRNELPSLGTPTHPSDAASSPLSVQTGPGMSPREKEKFSSTARLIDHTKPAQREAQRHSGVLDSPTTDLSHEKDGQDIKRMFGVRDEEPKDESGLLGQARSALDKAKEAVIDTIDQISMNADDTEPMEGQPPEQLEAAENEKTLQRAGEQLRDMKSKVAQKEQ